LSNFLIQKKDQVNIRWFLFFIVILGIVLRIPSVFNGLPNFIQIDEGLVNTIILDLHINDLNPHDFVYPGLIYYILLPVFIFFKLFIFPHVINISNLGPFYSYVLIGRVFIAIFGVTNILLIYVIGKKLFDSYTGLIAALFLAIDPMNIVWSFILKPDMLMSALVLTAFLFICKLYTSTGEKNNYILIGLFIGLAAAAKYNAILVIVPFLWVHFLVLRKKADFINKNFFLTLVCICLIFFIFNPFILLDFSNFLKNIRSELQTAMGGFYLNPITNRQGWFNYPIVLGNILGAGILILSICGFISSIWRHTKKDILILSFPLVYYIIMGAFRNNPAHYLLPVIPFILLLAAQFLRSLIQVINQSKLVEEIRYGIIALIILSFISPTIYSSVYYLRWINQKDTRILVKDWMQGSVYPGSRLLIDGFGEEFSFVFLKAKTPYNIEVIRWDKKIDYQALLNKNKFDFIVINYTKNRPKDMQPLYDFIDQKFLLIKKFEPNISRPAASFMYSPLYHPTIIIYDGRRLKL
jgi:hypothetical protein